ncbi:MAG: response regulator [Urechidicola sp.]|nr:response regulator [Urechidicola sp.]
MIKELCVLIVDDHPMILDAHKNAFEFISTKEKKFKFVIHLAKNCETAYRKIFDASLNRHYDLVLLDIGLPPSLDGEILSGEDLGMKIKKLMPKCKTIISTSYSDTYRLHGILNSVNPDGLLVKSDVTFKEIVNAINKVLYKPPYYSQTVLDLLRKQISTDYALNKADRQLLYELSIGTKMKELPSILPMSLTTIEKRKHFFKDIFNVQKKSDRDLVLAAKEKGFI